MTKKAQENSESNWGMKIEGNNLIVSLKLARKFLAVVMIVVVASLFLYYFGYVESLKYSVCFEATFAIIGVVFS